jgi:hypothetical protein
LSITVTDARGWRRASSRAAASPTIPAPMTAMSVWRTIYAADAATSSAIARIAMP